MGLEMLDNLWIVHKQLKASEYLGMVDLHLNQWCKLGDIAVLAYVLLQS